MSMKWRVKFKLIEEDELIFEGAYKYYGDAYKKFSEIARDFGMKIRPKIRPESAYMIKDDVFLLYIIEIKKRAC